MSKRRLKQEIRVLLGRENLAEIAAGLTAYRPEDCLSPLFAALCSIDPLVHWHAVSGFGMVIRPLAEGNIEAARVVMRRLLWSLNDESGGIGWGAPQAMAEIIANQPQLAEEYLHMLLSYTREDGDGLFQDGNYIELPMLQRGLLWGIGRLCPLYGNRIGRDGGHARLASYLSSSDSVVRGMALWCLGRLAAEGMGPAIAALRSDQSQLTVYDEGNFQTLSIDQLVEISQRATGQGPTAAPLVRTIPCGWQEGSSE